MSIVKEVANEQNTDEMLLRALERLIQLYTDKTHFIYELLQNAEDAEASNIKFFQFSDRLEVVHNGRPFTKSNLQGLCNIGLSDKTANLNQIGEFGVGFKSVFGICETVQLYSHPSYEDYDDDCENLSLEILEFRKPVEIEDIQIDDGFTTKFVFPYCVERSFSNFKDIKTLNEVLSEKLQNLGITTLLFMKNLQSIEYYIDLDNLKTNGIYLLDKKDISDNCKLVSAIGQTDKNEEENVSYIIFSKNIVGLQIGRTIDIAFAVNIDQTGQYVFKETADPYVSVYFPTEKESKLKFIVQGPYRTTPNRSSIPDDDVDNIELANQTAQLLKESIIQLKEAGILNFSFLNILPINFSDFRNAPLFKNMFFVIKDLLKKEALLPSKSNKYVYACNAKIARKAELTDVYSDALITELINDGKEYYWLPTFLTETSKTYKALYDFLTDDLDVEIIRPENFKTLFENNIEFLKRRSNVWLIKLYKMYETVEFAFAKQSGKGRMLLAPFIKTIDGNFVSPYRKGEGTTYLPNVFIPVTRHEEMEEVNFIDKEVYQNCHTFFENVLGVQKPNEYEIFRKNFISRYETSQPITTQQHIKDLLNLKRFGSFDDYREEVEELIKDYFKVRCTYGGTPIFVNPYQNEIFFEYNDDGMSIKEYYKNIDEKYYIDCDLYEDKGIDRESLKAFGIIDNVAIGEHQTWGRTYPNNRNYMLTWNSIGPFRWHLTLDRLDEVITYIAEHSEEPNSIMKSAFIFRFLKVNELKLKGSIAWDNRISEEKVSNIISLLTGEIRSYSWNGKWLYNEACELVSQSEISKHDLNTAYYGEIDYDSQLYELLKFKKNKDDKFEESQKSYNALTEEQKNHYFEIELMRRYGISVEELDHNVTSHMSSQSSVIAAEPDLDEEFPSSKVKNWNTLRKHAEAVLSYASPVAYQLLVRRIRVSRPSNDTRAYLKSMYKGEETSRCACQMCHKFVPNLEIAQIQNKPTVELDQMNLFLCPNCAAEFKRYRNDNILMDRFLNKIFSLSNQDIEDSEPVKINLMNEEIWFTQTHIAEIRELLKIQEDVKNLDSNQVDDVVENNEEKELIGQRVYHNKLKCYAVITNFEKEKDTISLQFEDGQFAKETKNYLYSTCIKNNIFKFV